LIEFWNISYCTWILGGDLLYNYLSMTALLRFCLLLCTMMLVSCGANNLNQETPDSQANTWDENSESWDVNVQDPEMSPYGDVMSFDEISSKIWNPFKNNDQFLSCAASSLDSCINEVTYWNGETPSCDVFLLEQNRTACEENILIMQAKESKDISVCEGLELNAENCKYEVAVSIGLEDFDLSACEAVSDEYTILCNNEIVMAEAKSTLDVSACDKILSYDEEEFEVSFCQEEVTFRIEENERLEQEAILEAQMQAEIQAEAETQLENQIQDENQELDSTETWVEINQ